jgi:hypothetical protein
MTSRERETFEQNFGIPVPPALGRLLGDDSLRATLPVGYRFAHVSFALEIQYMLSLEEAKNYDVDNKRLAFAVSTDGHELLVDLSDQELRMMQNEFGDVDYIGITIQDLLDGSRTPL